MHGLFTHLSSKMKYFRFSKLLIRQVLSLNNLNSSPSEDLIPSVRVSVMLMFSKFLNNLSISLDKPTEIC